MEEVVMSETTRRILLPAQNTDKNDEKEEDSIKVPRKKMVAKNADWIIAAETYSTQESQTRLLLELKVGPEQPLTVCANILRSHLKTKQSGYRSQDTIKGLYDQDRFVQVCDIVDLLVDSGLSCFYCKKWATLFYENVRDPRQWSLERISNDEGHNRGNLVIACLDCNMRRRTMYQERYIITKQLRVNKLI